MCAKYVFFLSPCELWGDPEEVFRVDGTSHTTNETPRFCDTLSFMCDRNAEHYQGKGYGGPTPFAQAADLKIWANIFAAEFSERRYDMG